LNATRGSVSGGEEIAVEAAGGVWLQEEEGPAVSVGGNVVGGDGL